jgi:transposase
MSRTQWSSQSLIGPGCHGLICTRRSSQSPARPGCHGLSCTRWSPQCLARTRSHKQIVVAHKPWPQRVRGTPCCSRPELMPLRCNVSHVRACQQVLTQVRASRHCALITPSQCDIVINSPQPSLTLRANHIISVHHRVVVRCTHSSSPAERSQTSDCVHAITRRPLTHPFARFPASAQAATAFPQVHKQPRLPTFCKVRAREHDRFVILDQFTIASLSSSHAADPRHVRVQRWSGVWKERSRGWVVQHISNPVQQDSTRHSASQWTRVLGWLHQHSRNRESPNRASWRDTSADNRSVASPAHAVGSEAAPRVHQHHVDAVGDARNGVHDGVGCRV